MTGEGTLIGMGRKEEYDFGGVNFLAVFGDLLNVDGPA